MPTDARPARDPEYPDAPAAPPSDSRLARLLETESRLEASLADARRRAADRVAEARSAGARRRRAVEARLDERAAARGREIEAETRRAIASIRLEGARRARGFRGTDAATVDAVAELLVERVVLDAEGEP